MLKKGVVKTLKPNAMLAMTRVGYCPDCAKERRPKRGQLFIFVLDDGGSELRLLMHPTVGIAPHLYTCVDVVGQTVKYQSVCAVIGCGVTRVESLEEGQPDCFAYDMYSEVREMPLREWNALVLLHDFCDREPF